MMRKVSIAVVLVLAVAGCWQQEINGWDFGPLQGQWAGTFTYAGDFHLWQVLIEQHGGNHSGRFEGSHVTTLPDSTTVKGALAHGAYYPPTVDMTFVITLPDSPIYCEYHGQHQDPYYRIVGRISCLQADTTVVDQDMQLLGT